MQTKIALSRLNGRTFLFLIPALLMMFKFSAVVVAGEQRVKPWPFELSELEPDSSVVWGRLENGVRYAIMPNREPRERVSLRLYVGSGSLDEREDQRGLAHLLEHMGFNGTENFPAGTLVEYFQRLGMSFGADTNAYTSFDRTVYMIELPDSADVTIGEGLNVLRDYAGRMLLQEAEVRAERKVVLSEMRTRDSVNYRTAVAEFHFLLPESIIPERFPIGTREVLESADRENLLDFYNAWYRPENIAVIAVGDLEPEKMAELIGEHFSDFEARGELRDEPDLGKVVADGLEVMLHSEPEASSTRVSIQTVKPYEAVPDSHEIRVGRMLRRAAMQILSRRLDTLSRGEEAPFSRGTASAFEMFDFVTNASIDLTCEPEQWEAALRVAEQELRRVLLHGFQAGELEEVKASMINAYEEAARRAGTRKSPALTEEIIGSITRNFVFMSPEAELEMMRPAVEAMTLEDVIAAFRESWEPEGRFVFITGNLELEDSKERIREVYEASLKEEVEPLEERGELEFAYADFGGPGEIAEQRYVEDLDLHQIRFENGVRLNVKRTDFQANMIHAKMRVGSGQLTEPEDLEGVALLSAFAFMAGGLGEHSADELRRILAGRNVGVSFRVGDDAFQFSGGTTPADLQLQLQLMAAYLTDPGYRPESLRIARNEMREIYRSSRHTAEGVLQAEVSRFLAGGDFRFGLPAEEVVMERDLADVKAWLSGPLDSGYLELTLLGDLEVEEAIELVSRTLGALPKRESEKPELEELRRVDFPQGEKEREFRYRSEIPNGYALMYWRTDDIWEIGQTRRLQVLARVFSDRMRIRVRQEMGDAYSPYAVSRPSDTYAGYGFFYTVVGIAPERVEEVEKVVQEIAADLYENGVTLDELERALKPIVASLPKTVRENAYWMSSVMESSQEYPQRLDWARRMEDDYASITSAEVSELAKRYLNPEAVLRVRVLPE